MRVEFYTFALEYMSVVLHKSGSSARYITVSVVTPICFTVTAIAVLFSNTILQLCYSVYHFLMNKTTGDMILNKLKHSMRNVEMGKFSDIAVVIGLSKETRFRIYSTV